MQVSCEHKGCQSQAGNFFVRSAGIHQNAAIGSADHGRGGSLLNWDSSIKEAPYVQAFRL